MGAWLGSPDSPATSCVIRFPRTISVRPQVLRSGCTIASEAMDDVARPLRGGQGDEAIDDCQVRPAPKVEIG